MRNSIFEYLLWHWVTLWSARLAVGLFGEVDSFDSQRGDSVGVDSAHRTTCSSCGPTRHLRPARSVINASNLIYFDIIWMDQWQIPWTACDFNSISALLEIVILQEWLLRNKFS